jgi:D-lactate dehydrogenase
MKILVYSTKAYDRKFLEAANGNAGHEFQFVEEHLNERTVAHAEGYDGICVFVNDQVDRKVLKRLSEDGVRLVALRCAGFNNVDVKAAKELGITVVRVPAYSPHAVAEHTLTLILSLNRRICRANHRVKEGNFSLDGLMGFDLNGKTAGVIGTGKIGALVVRILNGFGCKVLAADPFRNPQAEAWGAEYVSLDTLFARSDIISLHCPLSPETYHLIDSKALEKMKPGVMIINTGRGALLDTKAVTRALKSEKVGYLGLDVYEEEGDLFFEDLSDRVIQDDVFMRLLTFPNVLITGHQAFFTQNALENIAATTIQNIEDVAKTGKSANSVEPEVLVSRPQEPRPGPVTPA